MKNKLIHKAIELLPNRIIYWILIHAWAKATTGKYSDKVVTDVKMIDVIDLYE